MAPLKQKGDLAELMVAADCAGGDTTSLSHSGRPCYVHAEVFDGDLQITLRLTRAKNNQLRGVRDAQDFLEI